LFNLILITLKHLIFLSDSYKRYNRGISLHTNYCGWRHWNNFTTSCSLKFIYQPCGHIVTGDLNLFKIKRSNVFNKSLNAILLLKLTEKAVAM